jgi:pyruvate kinase
MKRDRRTKIVATLGPSSSSKPMIARLFEAGVDVFRINMSHTSHDGLRGLIGTIREVENEHGRPIGILVDLQGPKLRIGEIDGEGIELEDGAQFSLDRDEAAGDGKRVHLPHPEIFQSVAEGEALLLNDGKVRLRVDKVDDEQIRTTVEIGGPLSSRKGVSLPDTILPVTAMTPKDRSDLEFALNFEIDWVALSFIQRPEDIADARKVTRGRAAIMAKIEKPAAVTRLEEIMEIADGLMVARGDLGVELPLERVPGIQKQMTRAGRRAGKPVVVATQMLESMISAPVPTRAEVSDVATAVFEGADAVMLSAESAVGEYPVEAVSTMSRIAREVESDPNYPIIISGQRPEPQATGADAISAAMHQIADTLNLAAIVCYTSSGATGLRASRERPRQPIIALTPRVETGRRLAIAWGLHCVLTEDAKDEDDMVERASAISAQEGFATSGQRIIISAGVPFGTPGATNMLRIAFIGGNGRSGS